MSDTEDIRKMWENQSGSFPLFLEENPTLFPTVGLEQKKENEALMQEFSREIRNKMQQKPKKKEQQKRWEQELEAGFINFIEKEKIICLSQWMSRDLILDCKEQTTYFLDRVRGFDGTLGDEQIWQTLRNYFIYVMIVEMQGEKQNANDPILAYSLLYPYTDNYIDDENIMRQEKERYNRMIALKLNGEQVSPRNVLEERTCHLLDMILNAYEGMAQSRVAETLLRLLKAQNRSIGQQKSDVTKEQIFEISAAKGSISVLADYLFATNDWKEYEESFYLKFGFLLQLVDDLQDIEEDKKAGSRTLMTETEGQRELEECVNRLLWFSRNVITDFKPRNPGLKDFVLKNCVGVTLLAAAMNPQFISGEYLKALEPYLPFSLNFLKKMKKNKKAASIRNLS